MASGQEGPGSSAASENLPPTPEGTRRHLVNLLRATKLDTWFRDEVVDTLESMRHAACEGAVPSLLRDTNLDPEIREICSKVAWISGMIGPAGCVGCVSVWEDPLGTLAKKVCERTVPEIVNLLRDTSLNTWFCWDVAWTLRHMGPAACEGAVSELVNQLGDTNRQKWFDWNVDYGLGGSRDSWFRWNAPEAGEGAVLGLVDELRDTNLDPAVRSFVAWTLARMGPAACRGAVPELVNQLRDTNLDTWFFLGFGRNLKKKGTCSM